MTLHIDENGIPFTISYEPATATPPTIAIPRTVSADVASRRNFDERREFERFDEQITKVETIPSMREVQEGR